MDVKAATVDIVKAIQAFNADRAPDLAQRKFETMAGDPFVFFRGTCHLYYQRLPELGDLRKAPTAWSCGDLHLQNVGVYRGENRLSYLDLNDFDEALLAPCIWDVLRCASSIWAGRSMLGIGRKTARRLARLFIASYAETLLKGKALWLERDLASGVMGELMDQDGDKKRRAILAKRVNLNGNRPKIVRDGEHALPATREGRERATSILAAFAKTRPEGKFFNIIDIARRIAGTGSLGVERYVVLVRGKGIPDGMRLIDVKCAEPSSSVRESNIAQPAFPNQAARVTKVQDLMQVIAPAYLGAVKHGADSFVVRELQPREHKLDFVTIEADEAALTKVVTVLGRLVAWAQLRASGHGGAATADALLGFAGESTWRAPLLDAAEECARRSEIDFAIYQAAFKSGMFIKGSSGKN